MALLPSVTVSGAKQDVTPGVYSTIRPGSEQQPSASTLLSFLFCFVSTEGPRGAEMTYCTIKFKCFFITIAPHMYSHVCLCPSLFAGVDQHGVDAPQSGPAPVRFLLPGAPAGALPLPQPAVLSRDGCSRTPGAARVAGPRRQTL